MSSGTIARASDAELSRIIESFDRLSCRLVLLEPYSIEEVANGVRTLHRSVERHIETSRGTREIEQGDSTPNSLRRRELADDHARFLTSLGELSALLGIIRRDDHGGNRQALGQYGKILSDALRIHVRAEAADGTAGLEKPGTVQATEATAPDELV
ncbi:MAG: hypothetical protein WAN87_01635 [Thermoplasmata archaeon]